AVLAHCWQTRRRRCRQDGYVGGVPCLLEDESEDNKEKSDSDSISPQDTETKQWLQKLAPVLGKGERHNKKAAIRLVSSRINQKPKNYDALCPELDQDHTKALMERSRVDLTPFNIVMFPRIVDGERFPQIGKLVRNLVAAQCSSIMAVESIFKKSKEEAAERLLDMFELVSQATGEAQQLRKQNINFRSNQFSYNRSPVSAALNPKDKKCLEREQINQYEYFPQFEQKRRVQQITICKRKKLSKRKKKQRKLQHANVGLNKSIQLHTDSKSLQRIYQLRIQSCNDKALAFRVRTQLHTISSQTKQLLMNVPDAVRVRFQCYKAEWEEIGASQILIEGAQANWKDVEAPEQLKKRLKLQEFRGT
ncbi:MAG: hypothetical protein EZS28_046693, partial [Streblomastix strix]